MYEEEGGILFFDLVETFKVMASLMHNLKIEYFFLCNLPIWADPLRTRGEWQIMKYNAYQL